MGFAGTGMAPNIVIERTAVFVAALQGVITQILHKRLKVAPPNAKSFVADACQMLIKGIADRRSPPETPAQRWYRCRFSASMASLRQLKPLEAMQLFLDAALQVLARAPFALAPWPTQLHFCISSFLFWRSVLRSIAATMSSPTSTGSAK